MLREMGSEYNKIHTTLTLGNTIANRGITIFRENEHSHSCNNYIADSPVEFERRAPTKFVQTVKNRFDAEGIEMSYPYRELTGGINTDNDSDI
jgi:hypothetical protein